MHGTLDVSHREWWPLSHREKHAGKKVPCQMKWACIPDNWLCISDSKNHPPVSIWPERKEREGERHVAGSHIPFLLEKYKALWPHVRCQSKPVFILKQKQTLTQLSTPKHIHPHSWRLHTEYYCSWLQLFWLRSLRGEASTQVTLLHVSVKTPLFSANYSSLSHYWPLFLSCWVKCGWA